MTEQFFDYFGGMLRECLDAGIASSPRIDRSEFPKFLTDDVRLHVQQGRVAAGEWGATEAHAPVTVSATHVIVTAHGLVYAAALAVPHQDRAWHYLAVPHILFESVADHMATEPPPAALAAVDCRLDHDLASMWQFEGALRRMLDDHPAVRVELTDTFAA